FQKELTTDAKPYSLGVGFKDATDKNARKGRCGDGVENATARQTVDGVEGFVDE
ncbi:hypothetical protein HDU93_005505, partial [Gonapodya sp. JEL0774]